jgi:hypothetical protein
VRKEGTFKKNLKNIRTHSKALRTNSELKPWSCLVDEKLHPSTD